MATELPEFTPVTSSNIAGVAHDGSGLFVKFHSGAIWHYPSVPAETHANMLAAESVGRFYGVNVRGKYEGVKLQGAPPKEPAETTEGDDQ